MEATNRMHIDLSIIIPIYNEGLILAELHERLTAAARKITDHYEFIFINDGSKDDSLVKLKELSEQDPHSYYINFSRNFGHQIAVMAGIDACRGEAVVIIDGDLQDPPELIPDLYAKHKEGYEVVYAKRARRKGENVLKKSASAIFYRIQKHITNIDIPVDTGDFRLVDRKVIHYLRQMPEKNKYHRGQIAWLGFNQIEVLFDRDPRRHGKSGYSYAKLARLAMDGITSFSDKPLQFVTRLGFFISFIAFLLIIRALYGHFILDRTPEGWTSTFISVLFMGGVQLISIGIIGAYLSRMNTNILDRPLYIIESSNHEIAARRVTEEFNRGAVDHTL